MADETTDFVEGVSQGRSAWVHGRPCDPSASCDGYTGNAEFIRGFRHGWANEATADRRRKMAQVKTPNPADALPRSACDFVTHILCDVFDQEPTQQQIDTVTQKVIAAVTLPRTVEERAALKDHILEQRRQEKRHAR